MDMLANPFLETAPKEDIVKTVAVMLIGLLIMTLTQITRLRQMVNSLAFKKFCSWLLILPLLLIVIHAGRVPFSVLLLFILWKSSVEFSRLLRLTPYYAKNFFFNQVVTGAILVLNPESVRFLPLFYLFSAFFAASIRNQIFETTQQTAFVIMGNLWIGCSLTLIALLRHSENGTILITILFGMSVLSDVFAYLFGSIAKKTGIGKSPLASNISPNKTVGGAVGSVIGAALSYLVFGMELSFPLWLGATMAVLSGVGATVGDLAESLVKRTAGVKDASALIPFHGGMLDRVDSLILIAPICYGVSVVNESLLNGF